MTYELATIFSFSIGIAAIIGLIRFKKINPAYYPFLYCVWIAFFNEVFSYFLTHNGGSNGINNNIYVLVESLLITWLFKRLNLFRNASYLFGVILSLLIVSWSVELIFFKDIHAMVTYYRVFCSFIIVLMAGVMMNMQLMKERRKNIFRNVVFLLCMAFLIYFTYKVIINIFWIYGQNISPKFAHDLYWILIFINLFTNLVYALAVLWMPTKHRFSLPS